MPNLYIIATPIGNLGDISTRALDVLGSVDVVLCEDTRVTAKLLNHYKIKKRLVSYHQHSDAKRLGQVIELLKEGKNLALVTDAGTPGISDPGGKLIEEMVKRFASDAIVTPIPGASAVTAALSISGFPSDKFVFLGFPPHKKGRQTYFNDLAAEPRTIVFYESTHRIIKTLAELESRIADRKIVVCRELTKLHETIYRGMVSEVTAKLETGSIKGEFVVVVEPKKKLSHLVT